MGGGHEECHQQIRGMGDVGGAGRGGKKRTSRGGYTTTCLHAENGTSILYELEFNIRYKMS